MAAGEATVKFLRDALANAQARGHEWVQLVAWRGNSPKRWDRCRVISSKPCLMGRCIGAGAIVGQWRFDVRVSELEAWLKARGGVAVASRKQGLVAPAFKDTFADGYEHALKDAYDHLSEIGLHDAAFEVGDLQGEHGPKIAKAVRRKVREWRAAKRGARADDNLLARRKAAGRG